MLLQLSHVTFGYEGVPTVEDASLALQEGERYGFVGANGEGKTTVLRLMLGELTPDAGEVFRKGGLRVGYLPQSGGFDSDSDVYGAMREVFREDEELIERLKEAQSALEKASPAELSALSQRIDGLERRIAARDSYHFDVKIATVLGGMGFGGVYTQKVATMSGGERTKLKLCRLLLEEPDLLVLDEPTNHLDTQTLFWLEEYLTSFRGALLIVSHDRYFLDRLTSKTLELEHKKLTLYRGNYTKYKVLKAERYKELLRAYEKQQEEIAKLKDFVDRHIVRATSAKSALSRVNKLERMEVLERPLPPPEPPRFRFTAEERPYERVLEAPSFDLSAGGKSLLKGASFTLLRGDRCALVGENGTGKSTLLKFFLSGSAAVRVGKYVKAAFYDQENADLDPEERVLDAFWGRCPRLTQTDARSLLARAGLGAEDIDKKVKELSGGMRAKLGLAALETANANLLVLDEPTNHLDLPARESLEEALRAYDGTLLFVSHDRRFIESLATKVYAIEDGQLTLFAGGYREFLAHKREEKEAKEAPPAPKRTESFRSREERAADARRRVRTKEIETRLEEIEGEEEALNLLLAECAADYKKVREISEKLAALRSESDALYAEYETLI